MLVIWYITSVMNPTIIASRIILHLAYKPTLGFLESIISASKPLEGVFEHWIVNRAPDSITFFDEGKKVRLSVSGGQFEFVYENPSSIEKVVELFAQFFAVYFNESDIAKFHFVGSQSRAIYDVEAKYTEYASAFYEKYYGAHDELRKIFADEITDVTQIAEGIKEGFNTHLNFGPLKPEQMNQFYPQEQYNKGDKNKGDKLGGETGLFIRSDVFTPLDSAVDETMDKMEKAIELNWDMQKQLKENLKELS